MFAFLHQRPSNNHPLASFSFSSQQCSQRLHYQLKGDLFISHQLQTAPSTQRFPGAGCSVTLWLSSQGFECCDNPTTKSNWGGKSLFLIKTLRSHTVHHWGSQHRNLRQVPGGRNEYRGYGGVWLTAFVPNGLLWGGPAYSGLGLPPHINLYLRKCTTGLLQDQPGGGIFFLFLFSVFLFGFLETGFLCIAYVVLESVQWKRLA